MLHFNECISAGDAAPQTFLTLPWQRRIKSRQRVRLDDGREAGLFLKRGVILRSGDLLRAEDGTVVEVRAAQERVSTVHIADSLHMARLCYHLGNRHVELEITPDRVRYPHDHVLDELVAGLGHEVLVEEAPLEPETGAYGSGHGHHHG
ncbi:MAG TPA: urease accessory protein UreE [Desulfobulbaceae bacterium]|nr:urease accessory protein UreE [Desulfobulbaceae bacterium]